MSILEQAIKQPGVYVAQGWQCPLCKRIWSPTTAWCSNHVEAAQMRPMAGGVVGGVVQGDPFHNLPRKRDSYQSEGGCGDTFL